MVSCYLYYSKDLAPLLTTCREHVGRADKLAHLRANRDGVCFPSPRACLPLGGCASQRTGGLYVLTSLADNDLGSSEFSRSGFNQTIEPSKRGQTSNLSSRQHHLLHLWEEGWEGAALHPSTTCLSRENVKRAIALKLARPVLCFFLSLC